MTVDHLSRREGATIPDGYVFAVASHLQVKLNAASQFPHPTALDPGVERLKLRDIN